MAFRGVKGLIILCVLISMFSAFPACKDKTKEAGTEQTGSQPLPDTAQTTGDQQMSAPIVPSQGAEGLFDAAQRGDSSGITSLLQKGIDINAVNQQGATILHIAAMNKNGELVRFLVEKGADINHKDSIGQTALMWTGNRWDWDTMKYLLEHGADPKVGQSPLFFVVQNGKADILRMLIDRGIDVNEPVGPNLSAIQLAKNFGHQDIVKILKEAGAKE